jgi:hypothetical protein
MALFASLLSILCSFFYLYQILEPKNTAWFALLVLHIQCCDILVKVEHLNIFICIIISDFVFLTPFQCRHFPHFCPLSGPRVTKLHENCMNCIISVTYPLLWHSGEVRFTIATLWMLYPWFLGLWWTPAKMGNAADQGPFQFSNKPLKCDI